MRALVTAEFTDEGVRRLQHLGYDVRRAGWGVTRRVLDAAALVDAARGCALLVTELEVVDEWVLMQLPDLRVVATARGGPVNVDADACALRGIAVISTPARNADAVADLTLGLLLDLARQVSQGSAHLRSQGWHVGGELPYLHFRGPELASLTLGIVGLGAVGRRVRQRAVAGFGMRAAHTDPYVAGGLPLEELLAQSDVVTLHCPRTPETLGLLDAERLALLPPGAYVLNTAGGGMVDEAALAAALHEGRLGGAALDVFATEPLPRDSPLLTAPRLLLTPHIAGASYDVVRRHTDMICTAVERLARRP